MVPTWIVWVILGINVVAMALAIWALILAQRVQTL